MKKGMIKREKGITLIALVVTIIVLIILAGISINLVLGENGIITKAKEAKETYEIASLKEEIKMKIIEKEMLKIESKEQLTESDIENILEQYGEIIEKDDGTKVLKIKDKNYEISYEDLVKADVLKDIKEIPTVTVSDENIWKNTKTIEISTNEKYKIIYTIDGTEPSKTNGTTYEGAFEVNDNCTIKAVYYLESTNQIGQKAIKEVTKIDKVNPTIETKIYSCLATDWSKWTLAEGTYVNEDNQLVVTSAGSSYSDFYYVQGKRWWIEGKGCTDTLANNHGDNGGLLLNTGYFDENYQAKEANSNGRVGNGWSKSIPLNKWTEFSFGARYHDDTFNENYYGFGENIQYMRLVVLTSPEHSNPTTMYSDLKVYTEGEVSNYSKIIEVSITEENEIVSKKYLAGNKTINDFIDNGIEFEERIEVMENGTYTIYIEDIAGNKTIETVEITGITNN